MCEDSSMSEEEGSQSGPRRWGPRRSCEVQGPRQGPLVSSLVERAQEGRPSTANPGSQARSGAWSVARREGRPEAGVKSRDLELARQDQVQIRTHREGMCRVAGKLCLAQDTCLASACVATQPTHDLEGRGGPQVGY